MGNISHSEVEELPVPFTHKNTKIKGLQDLRGPIKKNQFIVIDPDFDDSESAPIKFRYNTEEDDNWVWQWTPHPNEELWYAVKGEGYYEIPATDLRKFPYNRIIKDKSKMRPVELPFFKKQSSIYDEDDPYSQDQDGENKTEQQQDTNNNDHNDNDDDNNNDHNDNDNDNNNDNEDDNKHNDFNNTSQSSHYSYDPKTPRFQVPLPPKYDKIRRILAEKDPIPPHILNQYNILKIDAYEQVLDSGLINSKSIKCRFATKDLGSGGVGAQLKKHPVLMFFETEPTKSDDVVWVLHLIKDTRIQKAAVEFDCKFWKKFKSSGWDVSDNVVELTDISLSDIAKWSVQYEKKNPDYTELYNNCRRFMLELSKYIHVDFDEILLAEKVWYSMPQEAATGNPYKCFSQ